MDCKDELSWLRAQIDGVDRQLQDLFVRRMEMSKRIAQIKMQRNLPIHDEKREEEVLAAVRQRGGENQEEILSLMRTLMALSKTRQLHVWGLLRRKIILIGMPGCGKSTLAKGLALRLGWPWYDSDQEIERQEGAPVSEIFSCFGEGYFRELETKCIRRLVQEENPAVISLGGGAVQNLIVPKGVAEEDCIIVYVHRNVEDILCSVDLSDRPLLKDNPEHLAKVFMDRHPLYEGVSHVCIHNDGTVDEGVDKIWEKVRHYGDGEGFK
ncbi:MAG: chorismate mutase [Peptococcaceae bacterium]|nr:chorismate mutase [Peptococcaceae bacterium]